MEFRSRECRRFRIIVQTMEHDGETGREREREIRKWAADDDPEMMNIHSELGTRWTPTLAFVLVVAAEGIMLLNEEKRRCVA